MAVESGCAIAIAHVHDRGALVRGLGKNIHGNFFITRIETFVGALAGKTLQIGDVLGPAEGLNIFGQDLIDRCRSGGFNNFIRLRIPGFAVLNREKRNGTGFRGALGGTSSK